MTENRTRTIRETSNGSGPRDARPGVLVVFSEADIPGDGIYPLRQEVTIGRSPDCAIFLEDSGMSRFHAVIASRDDGLTIKDAGSHNGTLVNGTRIDGVTSLSFGELFRCGQTLLMPVVDINLYRGWRTSRQGSIVGGPVVRCMLDEVDAFARTDLEVLLTGESGTGKELVARRLHRLSERPGRFVPVNCAAITESLFEAELFGVVKGAYTGAAADRQGLIQSAARGTLFLDEVGELPLSMQAKLLRAVEQHEVRPVGGQRLESVDVRLLAATNRDLERAVEEGQFREDLYHRLHGARIQLPPLRDRIEDIPLLVDFLLRQRAPTPAVSPTTAFVLRLMQYRWPGNVRELNRVLREATARAHADGEQRLLPRHLRKELLAGSEQDARASAGSDLFQRIEAALKKHGGNVTHAAAAMGMHRAQIYAILRDRGMRAGDFR